MGQPWTSEQVLALAPDASSVTAGRSLARPGAWQATGWCSEPAAVWGRCQGSGKAPYETVDDLAGPAFRCSCPSRKFPCKHALGLLLLWSAGALARIEADQVPQPAAQWLAERAGRARVEASGSTPNSPAATESEPTGPADPDAAARRAQQRNARMAAGLADLQRWLLDQVRTGLAGGQRGYAEFDTVAARLVDAQLPGVAAIVRGLPSVLASGDGWPARLLAEYAHLHLLAAAHATLDAQAAPDDPLAASLRAHLGVPVREAAVLAAPGVRDHWTVLALRDTVEDRLVARRVWLAGRRSGRLALALSFAPVGQSPDATLIPGRTLDADLHFYPGAAPLRAAVGTRHGEVSEPRTPLPATDLDGALAAWSAALARDPWVRGWPAVLAAAVPVRGPDEGRRWWLRDATGALPLVLDADEDPWELVAVSGGVPGPVAVEVLAEGVRALAVLAPDDVAQVAA